MIDSDNTVSPDDYESEQSSDSDSSSSSEMCIRDRSRTFPVLDTQPLFVVSSPVPWFVCSSL